MSASVVPFLDVGASYRELKEEIDSAYQRVMESGVYLLGPELERFEESWASYCGVTACAGVGSGLDALVLALRALDVGPGDEVIVPSHTFIATWLAVTAVGATIVPVEPDERTYNITPESVDAAMTSRTSAIIPVHLYGAPVDVRGIDAIGRRHDVPVIYDAAQAHGARVDGDPVGSFGTLSAWSFYPGKNLGAFGDGGAVTSNDPALIAKIKRLRNYGSSVKYQHDELGVNSRLDEFQAAVLSAKLTKLGEWTLRRSAIAERYREGLSDCDLALPSYEGDGRSSWHLFVIRSVHRDRIFDELTRRGVQVGIHYPVPPHLQRSYREVLDNSLPVSELVCSEILSLPIGPHLGFDSVIRVVTAVREILGDNLLH